MFKLNQTIIKNKVLTWSRDLTILTLRRRVCFMAVLKLGHVSSDEMQEMGESIW